MRWWLLLLLLSGTDCTFAWYQAQSNAAVNVATASGNLTATASQVALANYTINFTVTPVTSTLQLSHVATSAEGTADEVGGVAVDDLDAGDLVYGGVHNGTVQVIKAGSATGFITGYSITAEWDETPADSADVAALGGKKFTINLGVTGNANLLASSAVTGLTNYDSATAVVHIAANMGLTVNTISRAYVHIEPTELDDSETGTVGAVTVQTATNVSLTSDN